jgi:Fungal specific transcription factor domain
LTYNFTHSISYAKLILATATKEALPSGLKKELSPKTATDDTALIKVYVDNLSQILPILDDTQIWRSWHAVSGNDGNATAMDYWTSRLILAIASAMQSQQRGDSKSFDALGHICAALDVADKVLHPGSIYSIQAMFLLIQYSILDPLHFDAWTLVGAASRAMIDIGLHQDPSKSSNTPREKLELRRRVYHCVYAIDR